MHFSFLELHPHLSSEDAWAPRIAEPSLELKHISGGMSQVVAQVLKLFFGFNTFHISSGGIRLSSPNDNPVRLFAELAMVLQDGGAHKTIWGCKGDAGTRMCMLCKNGSPSQRS